MLGTDIMDVSLRAQRSDFCDVGNVKCLDLLSSIYVTCCRGCYG